MREGFLTVFVHLPLSLGTVYEQFIPRILPAILNGLADETTEVRKEAARVI